MSLAVALLVLNGFWLLTYHVTEGGRRQLLPVCVMTSALLTIGWVLGRFL